MVQNTFITFLLVTFLIRIMIVLTETTTKASVSLVMPFIDLMCVTFSSFSNDIVVKVNRPEKIGIYLWT